MGSYAECWLGSFYVGSTKDDVDTGLMQLFRSSDRRTASGSKENLPFEFRRWAQHLEDDEEVSITFYSVPASMIRDRLELSGYTLETAKSAFSISVRAETKHYLELAQGQHGDLFTNTAELLEKLDVDVWLAALHEIRVKGLKPSLIGGDTKPFDGQVVGYMLNNDWYGYSGPDQNVGLRLALEVCSESDVLVYDVTDLILSECFSAGEDLVEYSLAQSSSDYSSTGKIIVLTEGRSDGRILSDSLKLLYPHLFDYFTFMDFDGARIGGGAGNLVNTVKAFAGAGIVNKIIALFDNDTAAIAALQSLRSLRLPKSICVKRLPDLASLRDYPTVGPTGMSSMDVNGIAASIELYLGRDVLADESGTLTPVQWTGYEPSLRRYQGELVTKDVVQERFARRLNECRQDPTLIGTTDWTGIRTILAELFDAFRDVDREDI